MQIGAHVSISGGLDLAIARGSEIGARAIQTFASSPRTLAFQDVTEETVEKYLKAKTDSEIESHVFHAVYLVNLANEKKEYVEASIESLIKYQKLAGRIGAIGTIFHVGSHKGAGFDKVKESVAKAIVKVVANSPKNTVLILENAAGHAGTIGQTLDELAYLINTAKEMGADEEKIGLCIDTQHAFVSGVDGRNIGIVDDYLNQIENLIGLQHLKVIHVNDSKFELGAHRDRHENIGSGFLGNEGIANWLNHPKLDKLPFILEVPGREGNGPGKKDIQELKSLVG